MTETKQTSEPSVTCKGLTFLPIPKFTDVDCAFGADIGSYFDRRDLPAVPREFKDETSRLFFKGGAYPAFGSDVDVPAAKRAICAWLTSFAPAHEAKTATVAYALWVWSPAAAEARAASLSEAR